MRIAIFPFHLFKVLRLPRKSEAGVIRSDKPVSQNHLSKPEDLMLQNATPLNISDEHVSCTAPATRNPSLQIFFKCPTACHRFWKCYKTFTFCSLLAGCRIPCACHTKRSFNVQKWREHLVFWALWLRNVLRATTVCTFSTFELPIVLKLKCFVHFDFEMCFAPQRRALFEHLNFPKCSEPVSFLHVWLRNVLRATTACTFSTSQLPKVVRTPGAFNILTSKCASRHNGVQFFISHLPRWLRTRRFSEPTFRPSGATNHWKNTVNRDFSTFSCTCTFFLLTLSSLIFSLLLFSSLLWLFRTCSYCRKFDF